MESEIVIAEIRELMKRDKFAAGAQFHKIRKSLEASGKGGWSHFMHVNRFRWQKVSQCLATYDPVLYPPKQYGTPVKPKQAALPVPAAPLGEIHEATRGFRAMILKASREEDMGISRKRRTVAFAHFKFLLINSTLPALMQMTPDEIIILLRTI
jgi:hypothetical protein